MVNFDIPSAVERRKNDDKFFATRLWESLIKSIHSKELELTTRVIKDKRSLRSTKRTVVENCISGNDICDWVLDWSLSQGMKDPSRDKAKRLCARLVTVQTLLPVFHSGQFFDDDSHIYKINENDPNFCPAVARRGTQKQSNFKIRESKSMCIPSSDATISYESYQKNNAPNLLNKKHKLPSESSLVEVDTSEKNKMRITMSGQLNKRHKLPSEPTSLSRYLEKDDIYQESISQSNLNSKSALLLTQDYNDCNPTKLRKTKSVPVSSLVQFYENKKSTSEGTYADNDEINDKTEQAGNLKKPSIKFTRNALGISINDNLKKVSKNDVTNNNNIAKVKATQITIQKIPEVNTDLPIASAYQNEPTPFNNRAVSFTGRRKGTDPEPFTTQQLAILQSKSSKALTVNSIPVNSKSSSSVYTLDASRTSRSPCLLSTSSKSAIPCKFALEQSDKTPEVHSNPLINQTSSTMNSTNSTTASIVSLEINASTKRNLPKSCSYDDTLLMYKAKHLIINRDQPRALSSSFVEQEKRNHLNITPRKKGPANRLSRSYSNPPRPLSRTGAIKLNNKEAVKKRVNKAVSLEELSLEEQFLAKNRRASEEINRKQALEEVTEI